MYNSEDGKLRRKYQNSYCVHDFTRGWGLEISYIKKLYKHRTCSRLNRISVEWRGKHQIITRLSHERQKQILLYWWLMWMTKRNNTKNNTGFSDLHPKLCSNQGRFKYLMIQIFDDSNIWNKSKCSDLVG